MKNEKEMLCAQNGFNSFTMKILVATKAHHEIPLLIQTAERK